MQNSAYKKTVNVELQKNSKCGTLAQLTCFITLLKLIQMI